MNITIKNVFEVLGVLLVVLFLIGAVFNLLVRLDASTSDSISLQANTSAYAAASVVEQSSVSGTSFVLSAAQKQALMSLGLEAGAVPSVITVEQEACFVSVLGAEKAEAIKTGDIPSNFDFFRLKKCI